MLIVLTGTVLVLVLVGGLDEACTVFLVSEVKGAEVRFFVLQITDLITIGEMVTAPVAIALAVVVVTVVEVELDDA